MLLIQDVHIVIGREELPFDDAYQNVFAPRVAEDAGTRLAAFFWAPHGAGEGYEAVTLTAVADADALARHQERLATGDLADCWLELEAKHRQLQSSLHVVAEWSPFAAAWSRRVHHRRASHRAVPARLVHRRRTSRGRRCCSRVAVPQRIRRRHCVDHRMLVTIPRRPRRTGRIGAQPRRVRRSAACRVCRTHPALDRCARAPRSTSSHPGAA